METKVLKLGDLLAMLIAIHDVRGEIEVFASEDGVVAFPIGAIALEQRKGIPMRAVLIPLGVGFALALEQDAPLRRL